MENLSLLVLVGQTGSGKTRLLRSLDITNYQILDLERIACHSGSVFGAFCQEEKILPQKKFIETLLLQCSLFNKEIPVITEWKGKKLGPLKIPDFLYTQMITAPKILIKRNRELRIRELLSVYEVLDIEKLYKALFSLRSKFDKNNFELALQALKERNKVKFVEMMLKYYDASPEYKISQNNLALKLEWDYQPVEDIIEELKNYFELYFKSNSY